MIKKKLHDWLSHLKDARFSVSLPPISLQSPETSLWISNIILLLNIVRLAFSDLKDILIFYTVCFLYHCEDYKQLWISNITLLLNVARLAFSSPPEQPADAIFSYSLVPISDKKKKNSINILIIYHHSPQILYDCFFFIFLSNPQTQSFPTVCFLSLLRLQKYLLEYVTSPSCLIFHD